jgi:hypothetical protein
MHDRWNEFGLLEHIGNKNVSVIMLGAREGVQHGSYAFLAKPLEKVALLDKLTMLIQHRQSELHDHKENTAMRKEIEMLHERTLHTPVQIVVDSFADLLSAPGLTPELRVKVESLRNLIVQNQTYIALRCRDSQRQILIP